MSKQVVKRYDPEAIETRGSSRVMAVMTEDVQGDYVSWEDYDALHQQAEALQATLRRIESIAECGSVQNWLALPDEEKAKWFGLHVEQDSERLRLRAEDEALRAENARLNREAAESLAALVNQRDAARTQLEAARGLLRDMRHAARFNPSCQYGMVNPCRCGYCVDLRVDAFLTATPAPEVPDHIADTSKMAEQGERQEAVVPAKPQWAEIVAMVNEVLGSSVHKYPCENGSIGHEMTGMNFNSLARVIDRVIHRYTTPQPGPDVRALAAFALELIDGALEGGSFDGGDIQDAGVRHGLLVVEQREESCGEYCDCAEYGFPAECYRLTPALAGHRQAQRKGESHDT